MSQVSFPDLAQRLGDAVTTVMDELRPHLVESALSGDHGERANTRHAGNFLSSYDLQAHDRYRQLITPLLPAGFIYASEEADPEVIGDDPDPDLCVLVDPLDTSELAVRALHGYTHVMVYSRALRRPVAAVVGDIYHHIQLYLAARHDDGSDRASLVTRDGATRRLHPGSGATELSEALVTNYLMRPAERFRPLARQDAILDALSGLSPDGSRRGRIGVDFGSVSLCHVAAGFTDATVEFAKGFAFWDLAPGHYILHAAGGTVLTLTGEPLSLDHGLTSLAAITKAMTPRQTFVAAASPQLADQILRLLHAVLRTGRSVVVQLRLAPTRASTASGVARGRYSASATESSAAVPTMSAALSRAARAARQSATCLLAASSRRSAAAW
jgi:fructose-1,6-bisphosphatase/inositol monophosphatase family enzyme